jgi:curli biogenesis system outer membrane secretion channel CsgG
MKLGTSVKLAVVACVVGLLAVQNAAAKAKSESKKEGGNLRYSITVAKFKNESGWRGQWNLGEGFSTIMTDVLNETGHFIVLGDSGMRAAAMTEQDFAASGRTARGKKTAKMGRMTPAQLLVRGSITHVQETGGGKGKLHFKGISFGGSKAKAEVDITIYLVNTETGQVLASKKVSGKSGKRGIGVGYYGSALGGLTGDLSGFKKDNVGKACEHAVSEAVDFLIKQLEDVPWEGTVVLVKGSGKGSKIIINRGTREGVSEGMKFRVGEVEELVDPDTGEVLDSEMTTVAELEAIKVKEKITYCKALSGADEVKKGMTVFAGQE